MIAFERGDRVATAVNISGDGRIVKKRPGKVVNIGHRGALVRYDDGHEMWVAVSKLYFVESEAGGEVALSKNRPASWMAKQEIKDMKIDYAKALQPAKGDSGEMSEEDAVRLFLDLRSRIGPILSRRRAEIEAKVAKAQASISSLMSEVKAAERILEETRAAYQDAAKALVAYKEELAELEKAGSRER